MNFDRNRREFLKIAAGASAAVALPTKGAAQPSSKMIGIQVGAVSFVDEGTEKVLTFFRSAAV
jgi:TAT (twin-arginine translocation) pathway signal sequence